MNIKWFGHACFRLKDRNGTAFTDPFPLDLGYTRPKSKADMVTISHGHPNHSSLDGFSTHPYVITRPGEYEVSNIFVTVIRTYHDNKKGKEQGYNNVTLFEFNNLNVCHLGDLGHILSQEQVEKLGQVDVLLVPVGGGRTLNAAQAAEVISLIEPSIVIPMHYQTADYAGKLDPVDKFFKEMGTSAPEALSDLKVTRNSLPEETQLILLNYN